MSRINYMLLLLVFFISKQAHTQNHLDTFSTKRTIEVVGTSSIDFQPNQIFIGFTIKEYTKGDLIIGIEKTEKEIKRILEQLHINTKDLAVSNFYGYTNYSGIETVNQFITRKTYRLKLNDLALLDVFVNSIDKFAIESLQIEETSHSNLQENYKLARKEAMQSARQKADELLSVLNEKCGRVLTVEEIALPLNTQVLSQTGILFQKKDNLSIDTQKINLSYQVKVVFEIK